MASNNSSSNNNKAALDAMKTEVASSLGINLKQYNGDLTSKQAGSIGGEMVKRIIQKAKGGM